MMHRTTIDALHSLRVHSVVLHRSIVVTFRDWTRGDRCAIVPLSPSNHAATYAVEHIP